MNHIGDSEALSALGLTYNIFNRESQLAEKIDLLFKIEKTDTGFVSLIKYNTGDYRLDQVKQLGRHFMRETNPVSVFSILKSRSIFSASWLSLLKIL